MLLKDAHKNVSIFLLFSYGTGGRIRTYEGECRQIYSLLCLTAPQPQQTSTTKQRLLHCLDYGAAFRTRTEDLLFTKQLL